MKTLAQVLNPHLILKEAVNTHLQNLTMTQTLVEGFYPDLKSFHEKNCCSPMFIAQVESNAVLKEATEAVTEFIERCNSLRVEIRKAQEDVIAQLESHTPEHMGSLKESLLCELLLQQTKYFDLQIRNLQSARVITVGTLMSAFYTLGNYPNG